MSHSQRSAWQKKKLTNLKRDAILNYYGRFIVTCKLNMQKTQGRHFYTRPGLVVLPQRAFLYSVQEKMLVLILTTFIFHQLNQPGFSEFITVIHWLVVLNFFKVQLHKQKIVDCGVIKTPMIRVRFLADNINSKANTRRHF